MGYYISSMIGIRTGGIFSGDVDLDGLKQRTATIIERMNNEADWGIHILNLDDCMSGDLHGGKGSYVVIAGVFNYWPNKNVAEFARRLSKEFGTEVMVMTWDEQTNGVDNAIFLDGRPLFEVGENSIGRIIRRVT